GLAGGRDVHVFALHPSPALWERVAAVAPDGVVRRRDDPTAALPANRLLASWGRDARELQLVLNGGGEDHHHAIEDGSAGALLARLPADVRPGRRPDAPVAA